MFVLSSPLKKEHRGIKCLQDERAFSYSPVWPSGRLHTRAIASIKMTAGVAGQRENMVWHYCVEWSGVEWSRLEWYGVQWSGVD